MRSLTLSPALYLIPAAAFTIFPTITEHDVSDPSASLTPSPPDDGDGSELQNWSSLIGIVTAIVGNTLIALALNVQRYAHIRLQKRRIWARERAKQALMHTQNGTSGYGTVSSNGQPDGAGPEAVNHHERSDSRESGRLAQSIQSDASNDPKVSSTYLKDPYWWMGQVLITVGETGNFLAYGFAPASIVSPLGVVTLISNCVVAPMIFHERFRARDFWGVIVAIMGVVTVVLSANQKETKLGPHEVWDAITTTEFEIYMGVSAALICLLVLLSRKYGHRTIVIDLGLVGLFGAYTALSTKGISSMLSSTFLGAFTTPVTYGLIAVLISTAVMQIRYLNRALQRFDSTQVIPIQFVLFTLSVILGSAVLYRDFERTTLEQAIKFVGGCLLTFFGVILITSGRPPADDDEEHLSDIDGIEETVRLSEQNSAQRPMQIPLRPDHTHQQSMASSRRSSKSSKVSFIEAAMKPFASLKSRGLSRSPPNVTQRNAARMSREDTPLLDNPWEDADIESASRPLMHKNGHSTDSAPPFSSSDSPLVFHSTTEPVTPHNGVAGSYSAPSAALPDRPVSRPTTPTRPTGTPHRHHPSHLTVINPSPLSSTVSAVISETLLGGTESPTLRRTSVRRSRPSLRTSLFVPSDEIEDGGPLMGPSISRSDEPATAQTDVGRRVQGQDEEHDELSNENENKGLRNRARSLSNSIGELLGVSRLIRRSTSPDVNSLHGSQRNDGGG